MTGAVGWGGINVEGFTPPPGQELQVDRGSASADYFHAMEIPLRKGRFFNEHDTPRSQRGDHRREIRAAFLAARRSDRQASLVRSQEALYDRGRGGDGQAVRAGYRWQNRGVLPAPAVSRRPDVPGGADIRRTRRDSGGRDGARDARGGSGRAGVRRPHHGRAVYYDRWRGSVSPAPCWARSRCSRCCWRRWAFTA